MRKLAYEVKYTTIKELENEYHENRRFQHIVEAENQTEVFTIMNDEIPEAVALDIHCLGIILKGCE